MAQHHDYPARAFHSMLPKGQASASLTIEFGQLVFSVGEQQVALPLKGLQIKLGGAADRLLFFTHALAPDWQFYSNDRSVLEDPSLVGHPAVASVRRVRKQQSAKFWAGMATVLLVLAACIGLAYWSLDGLSAVIARRIPEPWEEKLGESVLTQYRLEHEFLPDDRALPLLKPLTTPLVQAAGQTRHSMRFYIVNDPAINAFALPGGFMVINSGLILNAANASQVQGVIAHEMAHVMNQHGVRSVIQSTGIFVLVQAFFGDASGLLAVLANAGPALLDQTYSRDFEREADEKGYALLHTAKINPQGMVDFFRLILAEEKKQIAKIEDQNTRVLIEKTKGFLSTHPETEERIAAIEKRLAKDPKQQWHEDQASFATLKRAVSEFVTEKEGKEKK